jgi:hypothetical protein
MTTRVHVSALVFPTESDNLITIIVIIVHLDHLLSCGKEIVPSASPRMAAALERDLFQQNSQND